jgi:uncharacterized protein HemY
MLVLVFVFLALMIWIVPKFFRLSKRGFTMLCKRLRGSQQEQATTSTPQSP